MKIALISDGIYPYVIGGMQKHSASLGVELVKLGYSVDLYHFVLKGNSIPTTDEVNRFHFNSTRVLIKHTVYIFQLQYVSQVIIYGIHIDTLNRYLKSLKTIMLLMI